MSEIPLYIWSQLPSGDKQRLLRRAETDINALLPLAHSIIAEVRARGDAAVLEYNRRYDAPSMHSAQLRAQPADFAKAQASLPAEVVNAMRAAHRNILAFHEQQMPAPLWFTEIQPGVMAGEKVTAIPSVAIYVPRGKGAFPSVMLMLGTPARVAGVERIVVITPPTTDGSIDGATLAAAEICGIDEVYAVGGIQALAAAAYGTERIPKVAKVVGPGSGYVAAAKRALHEVFDVGPPAGPSEAIIFSDANADPQIVALDLLVEAEHGPDSAALFLTHSRELAQEVRKILPTLIMQLPEWRREFVETSLARYGGIILTASLEASIDFVNEYAPEHLLVLVEEPFNILNRLLNAGEILLGPHTPIPFANYCLGLNAILPTGGFARSFSSVSVWDFLKRNGVGYVSAAGYARLAPTATILANYEGFPAHAQAIHGRQQHWGKSDP